ncbi:MAG: aminotransferase class V-fold PLP-dependent enzyme, partial [Acinetobacter sp.]
MAHSVQYSDQNNTPEENQIYLDYAATTPIHPIVIDKMIECMGFAGTFGNPASRSHHFGGRAGKLVDHARQQVADLIHADPADIIWTSGATESNNLALKGIADYYADKGKHIITSQIEHKAILDTGAELEKQGFEVTYLQPEQHTGLITVESVKNAIRPDTILVSLMLVNNEIGTLTDIEEIAQLTKEKGIFLHVDAAQGVGKVNIDVAKTP